MAFLEAGSVPICREHRDVQSVCCPLYLLYNRSFPLPLKNLSMWFLTRKMKEFKPPYA